MVLRGTTKITLRDTTTKNTSGKGSKYVRSRLPFELKWSKSGFTVSEALKEEYRIKQLSHDEKKEIWIKK